MPKTNQGAKTWNTWGSFGKAELKDYVLQDGTNAVEIAGIETTNAGTYYMAHMNDKALGLRNGLKLEPYTEYSLSFKAMSDSDLNWYVTIANTFHTVVIAPEVYFNIPGDGLWHAFALRLATNDIPGSAEYQENMLNDVYGPKFSGSLPTGKHVIFRDLKLELGNVATDWSPAPEDIITHTEFDELVKRVEALEQEHNT